MTFLTIPDSADDMLRAADELMYAVKRAGKNSVRYATFPTNAAVLPADDLEQAGVMLAGTT